MKKYNHSCLVAFIATFIPVFLSAQNIPDTDMERNVKVWISVAVLVAILCILFVYMFYLDNRLKNLEKDNAEKESQG